MPPSQLFRFFRRAGRGTMCRVLQGEHQHGNVVVHGQAGGVESMTARRRQHLVIGDESRTSRRWRWWRGRSRTPRRCSPGQQDHIGPDLGGAKHGGVSVEKEGAAHAAAEDHHPALFRCRTAGPGCRGSATSLISSAVWTRTSTPFCSSTSAMAVRSWRWPACHVVGTKVRSMWPSPFSRPARSCRRR